MDYKEKYEQALEYMRKVYPTLNGADKEDVEHHFPELKESEDVKIRKRLIEGMRHLSEENLFFDDVPKDKVIAWLEKQGEKTNPYSGVSFKYNGHIWGMCARDNGVDILLDKQLFKHLENQGEQKPTDKVEPKFKVGDWVRAISSGNIFKILSVNDGLYRVLCYDGVEANYPIKDVEKDLAYWTLKDAKDGDVLVTKIDEEPNDFIYIFKGYEQNGFYSHCYLDAYINKFHEGSYHNNYNVGVPATKEQRDFLFQKMKESGYEWDAEKKELRKIKQKHIEWSEEDEKVFNTVIEKGDLKPSEIHWLKSLKERME